MGIPGKLKVLHIIGTMDRGGAESWLMNLLRNSYESNLQMDFCVIKGKKGDLAEEIERLGSRVIPCDTNPIGSFCTRFARILKEGKYDCVHSHVWSFSGIMLPIALFCKVPVRIAHSHNTRSKHQNSLYRRIYSFVTQKLILSCSTHCLGCSSEATAALFGKGWQKNAKCKILYCSINTEAFRPEKEPNSKTVLGLPEDSVVVGNVGNLRAQKNHTFFLDIAVEFLKLEPRAYFFIAGEGPLREELEAKAHKLGIAEKIKFAGARNDVPDLMMWGFDVFLFPSLYEGMPLTLVEAATAGLRIVCSDSITSEATEFMRDSFTRLPLSADPAKWATELKIACMKRRVSQENAYRITKESHFATNYCLEKLLLFYYSGQR